MDMLAQVLHQQELELGKKGLMWVYLEFEWSVLLSV
jgi:hypothetical protein